MKELSLIIRFETYFKRRKKMSQFFCEDIIVLRIESIE